MAPILDEAAPGCATLFCCLACGMPFSFPDEAYTAKDADVCSLVAAVHGTRRFLQYASSGSVSSPAQWVADDAPFFPALARDAILRQSPEGVVAASRGGSTNSWPLHQVEAFHDLLRRCCHQERQQPSPHRVIMDAPLVSSSTLLCMGCATQIDEQGLAAILRQGIPPANQVPFATSLMHDAYTFAFAVVSCILLLVDDIAPAHRPPLTKVGFAHSISIIVETCLSTM
jgi:hypothetical protein